MINLNKYKTNNPSVLHNWGDIAEKEITKWLTDEKYQEEVTTTTLVMEDIGPFTKFLYHFAFMCECGWGVMVDFNERKQKIYLTDQYYKWMHKLRDQILIELEKIDS